MTVQPSSKQQLTLVGWVLVFSMLVIVILTVYPLPWLTRALATGLGAVGLMLIMNAGKMK